MNPYTKQASAELVLDLATPGIISFWNPYTKQASAELVLDLATPCSGGELDRSLCPQTEKQLLNELASLCLLLKYFNIYNIWVEITLWDLCSFNGLWALFGKFLHCLLDG